MISKAVELLSALWLIGLGFVWRLFGFRPAGRALLRAADRSNEQDRVLAVISLVKAGSRTIDLAESRFRDGRMSPQAIDVVASIEHPRTRPLLEDVARGDGPTAVAAAEALVQLDKADEMTRGGA